MYCINDFAALFSTSFLLQLTDESNRNNFHMVQVLLFELQFEYCIFDTNTHNFIII